MLRKAGLLAGIGTTLACALAQVQMMPYWEQEPNNSLSAPQVIDVPVSQAKGFVVWDATLMPVGERDFYRFQVTQAGTYSIRVDTNLDTVLRLYNASGALIAENDNGGNPDMPLNRLASGLTVTLEAGTYTAEVAYFLNLGRARYALRVFPGATAPDYDPTEPNDTPDRAINLGRLFGRGRLSRRTTAYLSYGGGDVDVYQFDLDNTGQTLTVRTQTYVDTQIRVIAPNGQVYENDDSEWDLDESWRVGGADSACAARNLLCVGAGVCCLGRLLPLAGERAATQRDCAAKRERRVPPATAERQPDSQSLQ
jgi:hypothetical protein